MCTARWGGPSHVRLRKRKRTIELTAAAHNEFYEGNVGFAIRLRTFAALIVNGNLGSIPAFEGTRFRHQRMSACGYKRTLWDRAWNVRFTPESGRGSGRSRESEVDPSRKSATADGIWNHSPALRRPSTKSELCSGILQTLILPESTSGRKSGAKALSAST